MTVKDKHDGFAEMRDAFAHTRGEFDQYGEQFRSDVREKQQLAAAFHSEVSETRSAFEQMAAEFEAYTAAFEGDIEAIHEAVTAVQEEATETADTFEAYTDSFESDVRDRHDTAAAFREEATETADAFEAYTDSFEDDVEAIHQSLALFLESVEETRRAHDRTRKAFAEAIVEFYGYGGERVSAGTGAADTPEATESRALTRAGTAGETATDSKSEAVPGGRSTVPEESTPDEMFGPDTESGTDDDDTPEGMVECLECGEYYQAITESHLQTHGMTMDEYRAEHGDGVELYPGED